MSLFNVSKEMFTNGVFLFENGNYIFIEEIQYSGDGLYWEDTFNPSNHIDPRNPTETLIGHKYRRVRHAGDDSFQLPEYIVAENGKTPIFRVFNEELQFSYIGEDVWTTIVGMDTLKGNEGKKGDRGDGWNIDTVGYWLERPDCSSTLTTTTSCNTCTTGDRVINGLRLFLSLGDGLHEIISGDIGSYYSDNGTDWIQIVATDVGRLVRYIANDAIGTSQIDYHSQDTLNTRGYVYYCADGRWQRLFSVSIPLYKVAPTEAYYTSGLNGFYIEDYVDDPLNSNPVHHTIVLTDDYKLVVKLNSIEPVHMKDGSFGDGLDEGNVNSDGLKTSPIKVKTSDIAGFGLDAYERSDGYWDLEVKTQDLVGDGLQAYDDIANEVDGEDRYLFSVNANDLIEGDSGLEVLVGSDGFDNLKVKDGDGILINANGVGVDVDDSSLNIDSNFKVAIKEYNSSTDGVLAVHLNPDVVNTNKGLALSNSTGIEIALSTDHLALNFDANGILVKEASIQGWHLNANVADENKSLHFDATNDVLQVKTKIGGGITEDSDGLMIDTSDLSWLDGTIVKKIEVGGSDYSGDLVMQGDSSSDTYMQIKVEALGQTINIKPETNLSALENLIDTRISSGSYPTHTHPMSDINGLTAALGTKVEFNVQFGNIMLSSNGLFIRNDSDSAWGKLISIDDSFNIGIEPNVTP